MNLRSRGAACLAAVLAVLTVCIAGSSATTTAAAAATTVNPLTEVGGSLVVTVGDIACRPGGTVTATTCRDADTAALARSYNPRYALLLGDEQYQSGSATEFRDGFDRSWGALKAISKPVPGNHEYNTAGAAGYYDYFEAQTAAPGYYAFDIDKWRIYALNSNCAKISCATETAWLDRDMTQHPRKCSLIMLHHPLYSSGLEHGDSLEGRPFWRVALKHHAELALAGHDHDYERFRKMNAYGTATSNGMVSFVVGTGGKSLYHSGGIRAGSRVFDARLGGVMALKLGAVRYGWTYKTIDGKVVDSGIRNCA